MGKAIGEILPLAIGVAISPVPIIAIVLMLGTPRARATGTAFALGWIAGLALAGTITLVIATGNATTGAGKPETWVGVLKLVLGTLFLLLAVKQWRSRPAAGEDAVMPKWMRAIDTFKAGKALAAGLALSGVNPKNLALTIAAATAIAEAGISSGQEAGAMVVFVVLGSLTILAPLVIYFALGARAARILDGLKTWMAAHNAAIMAVLLLVLGVKLIGDGIADLSA
jgi:threonine/homoserine/homoserine lactone efflux protein